MSNNPTWQTDDGRIQLYCGDCLSVMPALAADSIDSIVCDPPYGLSFMGKDWDHGVPGVHFWTEALRVAKPGAHLLAFGGTRTFHRLACAIEDAGWEIRDCVMWVYGSGFPKSHNVGLRIDKLNGAPDRGHRIAVANRCHPDGTLEPNGELLPAYEAKTEQGKQWQGWGTALKPAWEPIIVARKPLIGTVAENVLKYGTGAINVDGCRVIGETPSVDRRNNKAPGVSIGATGWTTPARPPAYNEQREGEKLGRWPANLIHDGSDEVLVGFPQSKSGDGKSGVNLINRHKNTTGAVNINCGESNNAIHFGDSGSAARFFYCAKASKQDRDEGCEGMRAREWKEQGFRDNESTHLSPRAGAGRTSLSHNFHPTVKPTALMRYLCKLVTPPNGMILDPFMGSGSTLKAAVAEGFRGIGIEMEAEYVEIAKERIKIELQQQLLPL